MPRLTSTYNWQLIVVELRSERYLDCTQESLARKLQTSVFSVSKWERGETAPTARFRARIRKLAEQANYPHINNWPTIPQRLAVVKKRH